MVAAKADSQKRSQSAPSLSSDWEIRRGTAAETAQGLCVVVLFVSIPSVRTDDRRRSEGQALVEFAQEKSSRAIPRLAHVAGPRAGGQLKRRRFRDAVIEPFADFMTRPGWLLILAFILLYKFGDNMVQTMLAPFFVQELGVTLVERTRRVVRFTALGEKLLGLRSWNEG